MRVISGTARGRRLKEPDGRLVRPTTDKVKESMFNIIQFNIDNAEVLDLFAGSGQLGIEALSRGARKATFVDGSKDSLRLVRENIKATGFENNSTVILTDAIGFLERCGKYDVVFLDPPYDSDLIDRALDKIIEFDILKNNGIIICETKDDHVLKEPEAPYKIRRTYKYGRIRLTVIDKPGNE